MTTLDVENLFLEIRRLMPKLSPDAIVTDDAPCFYNGFRTVLAQARTRLHYHRIHTYVANVYGKRGRENLRNWSR